MSIFKLLAILLQIPCWMCDKQEKRLSTAAKIADYVFNFYTNMYNDCLKTSMPNQKFLIDNLHNYINSFSKTTVGYALDFTGNRKFFANMINTADFKNMLSKDMETLQNNYIEKLRFCDEAVMDAKNLIQFYDREVDQTKL